MAPMMKTDELVKEYLLYKGFTASLKQLELESKQDKDKGFRVERIQEQLQASITSHDLGALRDIWSFLDQRLFCRLEQHYNASVRRLHSNLLKVYVITALQAGKVEKVNEFFDKMGPELHGQADWKEWFVLPYVKTPEENQVFQIYYSKQWQDTLYLSLYNFLNVIIHSMLPTLMSLEEDQKKISALRDKVQQQQHQMSRLREQCEGGSLSQQGSVSLMSPTSTADIEFVDTQDDFYVISQDTTLPETDKTPVKKFFNFGLPSSPVMGKKPATAPTAIPKPAITRSRPPTLVAPSKRAGMLAQEEEKKPPQQPVPRRSAPPPPPEDTTDQAAPPPLAPPPTSEATAAMAAGNTGTITKSGRSKFYLHHNTDPPSTGGGGGGGGGESGGSGGFLLMSQEEFTEHQASITHCRFSHASNMAASIDVDGVIKVWSLPKPVTTASIMSKAMLLSLEWVCNNDRLLLLGSKAGSLRLFDIKEKKIVSEVTTEQAYPRIVWLASSPDGKRFVSSASGRLRTQTTEPVRPGLLTLWDTGTFTQQASFPTQPEPVAVNCAAYNRAGNMLVTGAADGKIRVIDVVSGETVRTWGAHGGEVYTVAFGGANNDVFSMGSDAKFCQWPLSGSGSGDRQELGIHDGACGPFVLSGPGGYRQVQTPKGRLFALADRAAQHALTCGQDGAIMYQVGDGVRRCLGLGGHSTPVTTLDWSTAADTNMCLTGSMDGRVRLSTLLSQSTQSWANLT